MAGPSLLRSSKRRFLLREMLNSNTAQTIWQELGDGSRLGANLRRLYPVSRTDPAVYRVEVTTKNLGWKLLTELAGVAEKYQVELDMDVGADGKPCLVFS